MTRRVLPAFRIALVALVAGASALVMVPAHAASTSYAALGDSYSSGLGADDYYASSGTCYRGPHSYAKLWADEHSASSFSFVACSGATTDDVRSSQLSSLSSSTTLVTITIGGNDVGFSTVVSTCKLGSTSACASAVSSAEDSVKNTLPAKLDSTYSDIKAKAPNAKLVVLGYPRLFETTSSCGLLSMSLANRTALNDGADVLESVIKERAEAAGATYVSVQSQFEGHRVCASDPWINGTVAILIDSYHPKVKGYKNAYLVALDAVTG